MTMSSKVEAMKLSDDALVFGLGHLNGPKQSLSFGGDGAMMAITPRARDALNELIAAGYAKVAEPTDQIPNREFYRGTDIEPHLGAVAKERGFNLFDEAHTWATFVKAA